MTQAEIFESVQSSVPADLWAKYSHLSFGEMAAMPELAEYADELIEAEANWFEAEE
jgi:hypothetical protein